MKPIAVSIDDPDVASVALYEPLPLWLRLDVLPFALLYSTVTYLFVLRGAGDVVSTLLATIVVSFHALTFLVSEWSVDARAWLTMAPLRSEVAFMVAKVSPTSPLLPTLLCRVQTAVSDVRGAPRLLFSYQNLSFCLYDDRKAFLAGLGRFRRLDFPTNFPLHWYLQTTGLATAAELQQARVKFGANDFQIPVRRFAELLKEQLVSPFFVFQFFCMMLWCLDEYVYYSLFTLLMLVVFECTVVLQRQRNMQTLQAMRRTPMRLFVWRSRKWTEIMSDELLPGDVCSIGHTVSKAAHGDTESVTVVPCDLLLLRGSCIVNESMLTGESVPLHKNALAVDGELAHTLEPGSQCSLPSAPDKGCIAMVLRTGFGTTQGSLVRTILHSSQRVTANNREAMWFILLLLAFAVVSAAVVLDQGLRDPTRNRFKLLLHCVMIITSVVPPELPMELSLAVTNSLLALTRLHIFCTEPFRIPLAGRVDVCCFDKTGTLTSDELKMLGIAGLTGTTRGPNERKELDVIAPEQLPLDSALVLAGCQSLLFLHGKIMGDPLEVTALASIKWQMNPFRRSASTSSPVVSPAVYSSHSGIIDAVHVLHRYAFSSELKRMSAVVQVVKCDNDEEDEIRVVTKGAPEVIEALLTEKPEYYDRVHRYFAAQGRRVLALAWRRLPNSCTQRLPREDIESRLRFAGFLVLSSPLKEDSKRTVRDLLQSKHDVKVITGDNALTACDVAQQLEQQSDSQFVSMMTTVAPFVRVFARTSPQQKEQILLAMNLAGKTTLMCGDGTNDVGALKRAHVGISIVSNPEAEDSARQRRRSNAPTWMADLEDEESTVVQLGDASIASPFTSKSSSVQIVKQLVRQGRCTLVTTIQMYKILGVNCLITAYYLSALYIHGVKNGDQQLTIVGLGLAMFFLFLSYARPAKRLAAERPPTGVFCVPVLASILGQSLLHLVALMLALQATQPFIERDDPAMHPDGKFSPNVVNSVMFLLSSVMQLNTFVVNYKGQPFMVSFWDHKLLSRSAVLGYVVLAIAIADVVPALNEMLELVPMPTVELQRTVALLMIGDTVAVLVLEFLIETMSRWWA
ncbi:hypothetical protein P43SY_002389 [Pythium insidiosum]|uniref:Cation-transporting ATPase n=1 Tax=Pythium insidiosum TaxID=114742 RepID=A0AAD5MBF3_PYTIN|nr:hypothetical protein P43SY_002389 [Pythium insidiosum]